MGIVLSKEDVDNMRLSNAMISVFLIFGVICIASTAQLPNNIKMDSNCSVIKSAENASVSSTVGPGNSQATFILSWQNATSNLDMVLSAPDGKKIDSAVQPSDIYSKNVTMIQYTIPDPKPGNWTANVTAKTALESDEAYCVLTLLTLAEPQVDNESSNVIEDQIIQECPTCNQSR